MTPWGWHLGAETFKSWYTGYFISPSRISDLCGTVAGMVTPKGSMSTEGETLPVSVLPYRCSICHTRACGRNLITGMTSAPSPRVDISSTCKVEQKIGVSLSLSLSLLTCSPSAWPSHLLYRRGRKSRRDLWITLYCCGYCTEKMHVVNYDSGRWVVTHTA